MRFADLHPIASASLPWQLVLAIIVFNIVAGMISKRKQGKAKPGARTDEKTGANAGAKTDPQAEARKAAAQRAKDDSRNLEVLRRQAEARAREAAEAKRKDAERLARQARQAREEDQRTRGQAERPVMPKETRRVDSAAATQRDKIAEADPRPSPVPVAMSEPGRLAPAIGAGEFADPEVLRKAFIMKVILDKPLALAPRR